MVRCAELTPPHLNTNGHLENRAPRPDGNDIGVNQESRTPTILLTAICGNEPFVMAPGRAGGMLR
eukprot:11156075-Lingulodinium_polyedra.AAC.1